MRFPCSLDGNNLEFTLGFPTDVCLTVIQSSKKTESHGIGQKGSELQCRPGPNTGDLEFYDDSVDYDFPPTFTGSKDIGRKVLV